jgi:3-oxoacyl-[acyl-carrier protein] reductase
MIDLHGRAALVTGGSRGIGAATCVLLARAGCAVAGHYAQREVDARAVKQAVEAAGRNACLVQADLRDAQAASALPARAAAGLGRLDILVNNAGVWLHHPIDGMGLDAWRTTMAINLDAVYLVTRASLPFLRAGRGAIVNVVSTAAQRGESEHSDYAASKAAVVGWTKSLAVELAPAIRVNCVAPGWVDTEMVAEDLSDPARRAAIEREIPRGRVASADDIAAPIVFLASDLAAHITGEVLNVNGGSVRCG